MIVDKINAYLTENNAPDLHEELLKEVGEESAWIFERQFGRKDEEARSLRLSSIGKCMRQQAYHVLDFEKAGKEMDSRSYMVFFQGDMAELAVIYLAKLAGCNIKDEQKEVEINGIKGHPDATMDGRLVEIKSMSSYGFEKFEKGEIDESYLYQINAYLHCLGMTECIMVALNKDAGVLGERVITKDPNKVSDIIYRIENLKSATKDSLPQRPYAPDEKSILPWQCLYCAYWKHCWPGAEKILVGRSYKLKAGKNGNG